VNGKGRQAPKALNVEILKLRFFHGPEGPRPPAEIAYEFLKKGGPRPPTRVQRKGDGKAENRGGGTKQGGKVKNVSEAEGPALEEKQKKILVLTIPGTMGGVRMLERPPAGRAKKDPN